MEGEINIVFLVCDGRSAGDAGPTTGPGSPLQALIDAGASIFTFVVNGTPGGCAVGQPLQVIAIGGGDCTEVAEPEDMRLTLVVEPIRVAVFYTKVHARILRPLLASPDRPPAPLELRRAMATIDRIINDYTDDGRLATAA